MAFSYRNRVTESSSRRNRIQQEGVTLPVSKPSRAAYMREYRAKKRAAREALKPTLNFGPVGDPVAALCDWSESKLKIPSGPLRGQPFRIPPWQREFLAEALGPGIRESGLSVARKNGKTGLIAVLCLGYLAGPLNRPDWRGLVCSLTGHLSKELRHAVELTAATAALPVQVWRSPAPGYATGANGSRLDFLAADKATGHAVGADLAILDEAGLMPESYRDLWNAVLSSVSGRDGRLIAISVRGAGPMFSEMHDRREDSAVVWHEFAAAADCQLDDEASWQASNPGLGSIKSLEYMRDMSRRALASPADQQAFRGLDLNCPVDPGKSPICSVRDYQGCIVDELPERSGACVVGFDIGGSASISALCSFWPKSGRFETWAALPDTPNLKERGQNDGVGGRYLTMRERGELATYPGRVTPAGEFLKDCAARLQGSRIVAAGADRYRRAEVEQALSDASLYWPMHWRGTGASKTADGSHDVRSFQRVRAVVGPSKWLRFPADGERHQGKFDPLRSCRQSGA